MPDIVQSNVVDIYDISSDNWSTFILSQARSALAATTVNNLALYAGGWDGTRIRNLVDIYNDTSKSWFTTTLSQARRFFSATTVYYRLEEYLAITRRSGERR